MSPCLRVVLVDDEPLARATLRQALAPHPDVLIVGECRDGEEALRQVPAWAPELLFLDVHMPGLDGFELLQALPAPPLIILTTAYGQHALRAYEAQALDYLLKPLDPARVDQALERARIHIRGLRAGQSGVKTLMVRKGQQHIPLRMEEVDWIGAEGNYVALHLGTATYLHRESLGRLEARLEPGVFLRLHRGLLVNRARIRALLPGAHGDAIVRLVSGDLLPLSRRFKSAVRRALAEGDPRR